MKKQILSLLPTVMLTVTLMSGCADKSTKTFNTLSDFEGAKMASLNGTVLAEFIDKEVSGVEYSYYDSQDEMVSALSSDKVEAFAIDMPVAKLLVGDNSDFAIFPKIVADDKYGFAVAKDSALGKDANEALQKLIENGVITELENIWFSSDNSIKKLPELNHNPDFDGSAGTIRYGCDVSIAPMSYIDADGKPVGFDLDVMCRIAYELNMKIEFETMMFDSLLSSLASGEVDAVGGCMSITEDRLKTVDFIGSYYEGGIVLVVKKDRVG